MKTCFHRVMVMESIDKEILMQLQYNFPLSPYPFIDVARTLGIGYEDVLSRIKKLKQSGIIKRIGFYYNYRSSGRKSALIAFESKNIEKMKEISVKDPLISHSYLRNHPKYNVWIVVKRDSMEQLINFAEKIIEYRAADSYVILLSKKTYKLSVKYDIYKGVSRSGRYSVLPENPPLLKDLNIKEDFVNLIRNIEISERPYEKALKQGNIGVEELEGTLKTLLDMGVIGDPGAALDGTKLGFKENGMVVMEPRESEERLCKCVSEMSYSTHVVLRRSIPEGAWKHTCYAMVHAVSKELINSIVAEINKKCSPKDIGVIYSIGDLKPGVAR